MADPIQQHVFYRGTDDHIHHLFWDVSGKVYTDDWTRRAHAPLAAGNPATLATPGQQHVFYRGSDEQIHHIFWVSAKRRLYHDVWTERVQALRAQGDPSTFETHGQQHVFYRGAGGTVCHILWNPLSPNQLFFDNWTATGKPASGNPAAMVTAEGQQHVFYCGDDRVIVHALWDPSSPGLRFSEWTNGSDVPSLTGNLAVLATPGQQHVFYRGTDNSIWHIFQSPPSHPLGRDNWTVRAHAPGAGGDPAVMATTEGQQHMFYPGVDGTILHIFWDPSSPERLFFDDWTSGAHAHPAAGGRPATLVSLGQQHVFYRGQSGAIDHVLWSPSSGFGFDDWTARACAPMAAGEPVTLLSTDPPSEYTWKIMPLGDSITEGAYYDGGYRVKLFETANRWHRHITLVGGSSPNGPSHVNGVPFPRSHEGHSGKDIEFITGRISSGVLAQYKPDIVLLMIGTNDILQNNDLDHAQQRLAALLDRIVAANVCLLIVVAQITPLPCHSGAVQRYNQEIADLVRDRAWAGAPIVTADMHMGFPRSMLEDNVHPNQIGYEHMAEIWFAAIIDTLLT